jgi:hypothetical protein
MEKQFKIGDTVIIINWGQTYPLPFNFKKKLVEHPLLQKLMYNKNIGDSWDVNRNIKWKIIGIKYEINSLDRPHYILKSGKYAMHVNNKAIISYKTKNKLWKTLKEN